ncbi:hypothetical protein [Halobacterium litoreum]|uniref:PRC-barrel domain containing protein n=1 Tax=Halobacterium litoreum TaxID=2039234 RepID=A0ABD5NB86_9EURY|nr:hypothetical protein [Halobacterium litoreum]UHH14645.1 hypothetical protein LT972_06505 [Halobacterium litoreum]
MVRAFRNNDKGKRVVTADGDTVGKIDSIDGEMAHVKPDRGLADSIRQRLGWTDESEEMYTLDHSRVKSFSSDEVHLKD